MTASLHPRLWALVDELDERLPATISSCEFDEPSTVIYLTGVSTDETRAAQRHNLGLLIQPGNSTWRDIRHYPVFGADNGCFAESRKGIAFDVDRWLSWVETRVTPHRDRCLFVVAPDVLNWYEIDGELVPIGDAAATLERAAPILPIIRRLGLPAALVGQDGLEELTVPWDTFDVLFIGGSDGWKLGDGAKQLAGEARRRGKWVHFGRVNSWKRLTIVRAHDGDSADGTYLGRAPDHNWPTLKGWLDRLDLEAKGVTT